MEIQICMNKTELGKKAALEAADIIRRAIKKNNVARIILATGTSQFETLEYLTTQSDIDWSKVIGFHLDEYVGIPETHPASFRNYLRKRFIEKVATFKEMYFINGDAKDPGRECERLNRIIIQHPIDVALAGIGENGHLAFNDPPADFQTESPYIIVNLDEACRKQQMGEGWFKSLEEVPGKAVTMSVQQLLKSNHIICSVPDKRKARAVKRCLQNEVNNACPASILQTHENCSILLDTESASLLM